uniref:hypothetical protein n=1 Tax=Candidatus Electronema sp. TaxID=2698783 RepID=UPI004057290B
MIQLANLWLAARLVRMKLRQRGQSRSDRFKAASFFPRSSPVLKRTGPFLKRTRPFRESSFPFLKKAICF